MSMAAAAQYNGNKEMRHHGMLLILEYELPINGTPYVNELYKKGTITIQNADRTLEEERLLRFNAFTGDMEYESPGGKVQTLLKRENIEVEMDGLTYQVHPYRVNGQIHRAYFIPMNRGETASVRSWRTLGPSARVAARIAPKSRSLVTTTKP